MDMSNRDIEKHYNEYRDDLVRLAFANLDNIHDAEDVVQDVFTEALKQGGRLCFNDPEHRKNYFEDWVVCRAIDALKKQNTQFGGMTTTGQFDGHVAPQNEDGFNAILDTPEGERLSGGYGGDLMPIEDDYSEDSFP